ncbi:hypothetical protein [Eubacterium oxidoreducens]|uniref:hypothetical protein n=1 Tax=Eubacterium oxidoreducens TaxID=1732 RepID=UPI00115FE981|nr:hypothetical protein [Eubacterium oxidoreducens]
MAQFGIARALRWWRAKRRQHHRCEACKTLDESRPKVADESSEIAERCVAAKKLIAMRGSVW